MQRHLCNARVRVTEVASKRASSTDITQNATLLASRHNAAHRLEFLAVPKRYFAGSALDNSFSRKLRYSIFIGGPVWT